MTIARARKKIPVTPVIEIRGKNTTIGVSVEPINGTVSSLMALLTASKRAFAAVAVQNDVFDDHNRVVDHQSTRCRQASQSHHVEALTHDLHHDESHQNRHWNNEARLERSTPVSQKQPNDQPRRGIAQ